MYDAQGQRYAVTGGDKKWNSKRKQTEWMIAPVIQETYPDESVMAYCRRVAQTPMRLPDGRIVKYKPKTIGKWVSLYRNGGIDALTPKTRSDLGKARVLTEEAIDEIYRMTDTIFLQKLQTIKD